MINTNNMLPDKDGEYLVSVLVGRFHSVRSYDLAWYDVETSRFMSSKMVGFGTDDDKNITVTHWAVLPQVTNDNQGRSQFVYPSTEVTSSRSMLTVVLDRCISGLE